MAGQRMQDRSLLDHRSLGNRQIAAEVALILLSERCINLLTEK
jgi:hypothetical protein